LIAQLNGNLYRIYQQDGYCIYLNVSESMMMAQRACRTYEVHKHQLIKKTLQSGMTFIDVGGNKGDFTLLDASTERAIMGRPLTMSPYSHLCGGRLVSTRLQLGDSPTTVTDGRRR
jgi:hypothetical protein